MTDCDRCGQDIYTECHCQIDEMAKRLEKVEERVIKLESVLCLNDENKQSSQVNVAEIPTNQGNFEWIDREVKFPDADNILCCAGNKIFICELIESKCGDFYYSTDTEHIEFQNMPEWTHWMPLPKPPRKNGMD